MEHKQHSLLHELRDVLSLTRLWVCNELPRHGLINIDKDNFEYFAELARHDKKKQQLSQTIPANKPQFQTSSQRIFEKPQFQKTESETNNGSPHNRENAHHQATSTSQEKTQHKTEDSTVIPETSKSENVTKHALTTKKDASLPQGIKKEHKQTSHIFAVPYLLALPHKVHSKAPDTSTESMKEKVQKLFPQLKLKKEPSSDEHAKQAQDVWIKGKQHPQCMILSCTHPASNEEIFLQQVAFAINSRVTSCGYFSAHLESIARIVTLARHGALTTVLLAITDETQALIHEWLSELGAFGFSRTEISTPQSVPMLHHIGMIENTPIIELSLPKNAHVDTAFKSQLWKELKSMLQHEIK